MKKLILIIFLFITISAFAQDTCTQYVGRLEGAKWICTDTVYFLCDTVKGSGSAGGSQTDSTHLKAYIKLYNDLSKALKETRDLDEYKAIQAQLTLLVYLIKEEELLLKNE